MADNTYRILTKIAETGSLTRTAEQLNYTQARVSQILKSAETEFGLTLFVRGKRGVMPTPGAGVCCRLCRSWCARSWCFWTSWTDSGPAGRHGVHRHLYQRVLPLAAPAAEGLRAAVSPDSVSAEAG